MKKRRINGISGSKKIKSRPLKLILSKPKKKNLKLIASTITKEVILQTIISNF